MNIAEFISEGWKEDLEYQPQEEVYAEDIASEYDKETMLEALEEEWRQERLELQERQAYEDMTGATEGDR
jgi:hypothetical protein